VRGPSDFRPPGRSDGLRRVVDLVGVGLVVSVGVVLPEVVRRPLTNGLGADLQLHRSAVGTAVPPTVRRKFVHAQRWRIWGAPPSSYYPPAPRHHPRPRRRRRHRRLPPNRPGPPGAPHLRPRPTCRCRWQGHGRLGEAARAAEALAPSSEARILTRCRAARLPDTGWTTWRRLEPVDRGAGGENRQSRLLVRLAGFRGWARRSVEATGGPVEAWLAGWSVVRPGAGFDDGDRRIFRVGG
jgi:hypothetical protein